MLIAPPVNTYQFYIVAVVLAIIWVQSFRSYLQTRTEVSLTVAVTMFTGAIASGSFGLPFLFTQDTQTLSIAIIFADMTAYIMYFWSYRLFWLLALSKLISFKYYAVPVVLLLVTAYGIAVSEYLQGGVVVNGDVFRYVNTTRAGALTFSASTSVFLLLGGYFIVESARLKTLTARLRSAGFGALFGMAGVVYVFTPYYLEPSNEQNIALLGGFAVFMIISFIIGLIRVRGDKTKNTPKKQ